MQSATGSINSNVVSLVGGVLYLPSGSSTSQIYADGIGIDLNFTSGINQFQYNIASISGSIAPADSLIDSQGGQQSSTLSINTLTSAAPVPAPLPMLGLPAVLFYSRKLKKRIKASRETSSNALS